MIDIHNSILSGLDGNELTMKESLAVARSAVDHGIVMIIAAPPYHDDNRLNQAEVIKQHVSFLNQQLRIEKQPLTIIPGHEISAEMDQTVEWNRQDILSVNDAGRYVLVNLQDGYGADNMMDLIFKTQISGVTPIIARPELDELIQKEPNRIYRLVKKGVLVQISVNSVLGKNGFKAKKTANQLLDAGLVHLVASGSHDKHDKAKAFYLKEAYRQIGKTHGKQLAETLMDNIDLLVKGELFIDKEPQHIERKKLFKFFKPHLNKN